MAGAFSKTLAHISRPGNKRQGERMPKLTGFLEFFLIYPVGDPLPMEWCCPQPTRIQSESSPSVSPLGNIPIDPPKGVPH